MALINFDERFLTGAPQKKTHTKTKRAIFQFCFSLGDDACATLYLFSIFRRLRAKPRCLKPSHSAAGRR
jgi:hypothetical protein